jgi:hypothetical protein
MRIIVSREVSPPSANAIRIQHLPTGAPHAIKNSVAPWCAMMRAAPPFRMDHEPHRPRRSLSYHRRALFSAEKSDDFAISWPWEGEAPAEPMLAVGFLTVDSGSAF